MKILIIRLSSIGDILLTTAFIRQTRQTFPDAKIAFVVKKKFSELLHYNPNIDNLFEYDDSKNMRLSEFVKQFNGRSYDYIFDLHNNFRSIKDITSSSSVLDLFPFAKINFPVL